MEWRGGEEGAVIIAEVSRLGVNFNSMTDEGQRTSAKVLFGYEGVQVHLSRDLLLVHPALL